MTASALIDTNIVVYAFAVPTSALGEKNSRIAARLLELGYSVSVQVLMEFTDVMRRKHGKNWQDIVEMHEAIRGFCGVAHPLTHFVQRRALTLSTRYGFRIYDAMIVASALEARCTTLYSEDLQHGQIIEGLRFENPFLAT